MNYPSALVCSLLILSSSCLHVASARDGVFPEKGDRADWVKALSVYNQARRCQVSGDLDQALVLYEQARRMYPYDSNFYDNLAELYKEYKKDKKKAAALYLQGINHEPGDAHIRARYGNCLYEQGKYKQAQAMLDKASELTDDPELEHRIDIVKALVAEALRKQKR